MVLEEMETYIIQDANKINISTQEWNELLQHNETNTIFQTREWTSCWWDTYGYAQGLFLIILKQNDKICGIAPLFIKKSRNKRILTFIGEGNADYTDFIIWPNKIEAMDVFFDLILANKDKWDEIVLSNIPEYSQTPVYIAKFCESHKLKVSSHNNIICPALTIKSNKEYLDKLLHKKSFTRHINYFTKNGEVKHTNITTSDQAILYIETFFRQHIARCTMTNYDSLFLIEENKNFYRKLLEELLPKNWVLFSVIECDDMPVSLHFGFDYNNTILWYKPSFDITFYKHSPGQLMVKHLIEYAISNNRDELDFTIGEEAFKHRFTDKIRRNTYIKIYRNKIDYYLDSFKLFFKRIIKGLIVKKSY